MTIVKEDPDTGMWEDFKEKRKYVEQICWRKKVEKPSYWGEKEA